MEIQHHRNKTIGIIGGLGMLSGGDLFFKLLKSKEVLAHQIDYHFLFEQRPYTQINLPLHQEEDIKSRKFYTYTIAKKFEENNVDKILLPCFASHTFIRQLEAELTVPIVNIVEALHNYIKARFKKGTRLGVLTSDFVKTSDLFRDFSVDYELVYPVNQNLLMDAIYGENGIKNGFLEGIAVEQICHVCQELIQDGCEVILPGMTEISLIVETLWRRGISALDVNTIYAEYALDSTVGSHTKPFKLGILGGVGPSATVDLMNKIIAHTPARRDQDHIKMIVEQNPQIPDRTANLVYNEEDPTIAMFSTCKRLEAEGADVIAIPCNTAHAFVESIQQYLMIPIINMLDATVDHIVKIYGDTVSIGLLATDGTIASRVYHDIAERYNLNMVTPDLKFQKDVMDSIYGTYGVKAGYTTGQCRADIEKAINHIVEKGVEVLILGCTELPLMFPKETSVIINGTSFPLIDPTLVLAKKCVQLATSV